MTNNHLTRISFRVKPDERKSIIADAKQAGMTTGSYARYRLLEVPQTRAIYRRSELKRLFKHLIGQIGRVSNNMNQIAWKMNCNMVLAPLDLELHREGITALKEMRAVLVGHLLQNGPC